MPAKKPAQKPKYSLSGSLKSKKIHRLCRVFKPCFTHAVKKKRARTSSIRYLNSSVPTHTVNKKRRKRFNIYPHSLRFQPTQLIRNSSKEMYTMAVYLYVFIISHFNNFQQACSRLYIQLIQKSAFCSGREFFTNATCKQKRKNHRA